MSEQDQLADLDDLPWAIERVTRMCASAFVNSRVFGLKLLKGFGYPDEAFGYAQDARALATVLDALKAEHSRREAAERERDELRAATGLTPEGCKAVVEQIAERLLEPTKRITDELRQRAEAAEQRLARVQEAIRGLPRYVESEVQRYPSTYEWVNASELEGAMEKLAREDR